MDKESRKRALDEYDRTQDVILLKRRLGHADIRTTLRLLDKRRSRS